MLRAPRYLRKFESGSPALPQAKKKNPPRGQADDAAANDGQIAHGQGTGRAHQANRTRERRQPITRDPAPEAVTARPDELNLTTLIGKANALLIGHPSAQVVGKIREATNNRPEAKAKVVGKISEATNTRPEANAKPVMKTRQGLRVPINTQNPTATVPTRPREKTHWRASSLP